MAMLMPQMNRSRGVTPDSMSTTSISFGQHRRPKRIDEKPFWFSQALDRLRHKSQMLNARRSGMIDPLRRSSGECIARRLALGPDVWLAMIDRTRSTPQHLLRRQSTNDDQILFAAI
jgi:hypothetical protein